MTDPPTFVDCAMPSECECRKRLPPVVLRDHGKCLVPAVNATALALGWRVPHEVESLKGLIDTLNRRGGRA